MSTETSQDWVDWKARAEAAEAEIESIRSLARPDHFRCCACCPGEHGADSELTDRHTVPCNVCQDPWKMRSERLREAGARSERKLAEVTEAYEACRKSGQVAQAVLLDIWRYVTPYDTKHMTFGEDPVAVLDAVVKALKEDCG